MITNELKKIINEIKTNPKEKENFLHLLTDALDLRQNKFHPLVFINGKPKIGKNVCIGFFSEVNAKNCPVEIGDNCDIASFVAINVADSHKRCLGQEDQIDRKPITLEENVFIGSHSFIGGGSHIGHHSVVAAGTILINGGKIAPYSLIIGNPAKIKSGYYSKGNKK